MSVQVDKAFKELKESLVSAKKKRSQGEQQRKAPAVTEEQEAEELETAVGGATMNSRLSSLYSTPAKVGNRTYVDIYRLVCCGVPVTLRHIHKLQVFSRPGRSQGLLYKQLHD